MPRGNPCPLRPAGATSRGDRGAGCKRRRVRGQEEARGVGTAEAGHRHPGAGRALWCSAARRPQTLQRSRGETTPTRLRKARSKAAGGAGAGAGEANHLGAKAWARALSSTSTRPPASSTVWAADRPARPPPITMTCEAAIEVCHRGEPWEDKDTAWADQRLRGFPRVRRASGHLLSVGQLAESAMWLSRTASLLTVSRTMAAPSGALPRKALRQARPKLAASPALTMHVTFRQWSAVIDLLAAGERREKDR